jgi:hypothetical protein
MTKKEQKILAESLQKQIDTTNQMWEDGHSPAYIVGWLQGVIKATIEELGLQSKLTYI